MVNKKLIGITFGAGVLLGIKYKQIYVTKGFQNPVRYKLFTMMFGAINGLVCPLLALNLIKFKLNNKSDLRLESEKAWDSEIRLY